MRQKVLLKTEKTHYIFLGLLALFMAGAVFTLSSCSKEVTDPAQLRGGETRQTLDPGQFVGAQADAYRIAREIPQVLDSMHCYCECKKHFGHKSLLTCYVDEHARNCDACMDEAFMAYDLYKQGKDVLAIRKVIDKHYSGMMNH